MVRGFQLKLVGFPYTNSFFLPCQICVACFLCNVYKLTRIYIFFLFIQNLNIFLIIYQLVCLILFYISFIIIISVIPRAWGSESGVRGLSGKESGGEIFDRLQTFVFDVFFGDFFFSGSKFCSEERVTSWESDFF